MCIYQTMHLKKVVKPAYIITLWPLGRERKTSLGSPCQTSYEILSGKASFVAKPKAWAHPQKVVLQALTVSGNAVEIIVIITVSSYLQN